jgi:spermidine synthase
LAGTTRIYASLFARCAPYLCHQPCYIGGEYALNWASDEPAHLDVAVSKLAERQQQRGIETRYWTPALHPASFALPAYAEKIVRTATEEAKSGPGSKS